MLSAANTLGLVVFPAYDWNISRAHPEREERLLYTHDQLREEGIFDIPGIKEYRPDIASPDDIARVHFCLPDIDSLVTKSHFISAGGAIKAARLVMEGHCDKSFALIRPPGHHGMKVVMGNRGFCTINIEAVMLEYIRDHYGPLRAAIVDTDCHHGDGTQDIYWHDPDTLFISIHQDGRTCYPGTGFPQELGGPGAIGKTINIPLPPGTSDEGFLYALDKVVMPILNDFKPDLIINGAGQDNHYSDPLTAMNCSARGYADIAQRLGARLTVLEGGYSIQGALPYVNLGLALTVAGVPYGANLQEPDYDQARLRQDAETSAAVQAVCERVMDLFCRPHARPLDGEIDGDWFVRMKNVYYDTDDITEHQREAVLMCGACPGLIKIAVKSSRTPPSLCVCIPLQACPRCREEGFKAVEEAKWSGGFRFIQCIDRPRKEFSQYGYGS